jgi:hypothetical protein
LLPVVTLQNLPTCATFIVLQLHVYGPPPLGKTHVAFTAHRLLVQTSTADAKADCETDTLMEGDMLIDRVSEEDTLIDEVWDEVTLIDEVWDEVTLIDEVWDEVTLIDGVTDAAEV